MKGRTGEEGGRKGEKKKRKKECMHISTFPCGHHTNLLTYSSCTLFFSSLTLSTWDQHLILIEPNTFQWEKYWCYGLLANRRAIKRGGGVWLWYYCLSDKIIQIDAQGAPGSMASGIPMVSFQTFIKVPTTLSLPRIINFESSCSKCKEKLQTTQRLTSL